MIKGYVAKDGRIVAREPGDDNGSIAAWEAKVLDTVGSLIEFWGFKHNQGRLWALLYLRDEAISAPDLQELLGLSKGSVSTITRDLESWGVIHRVRVSGQAAWHFFAETDLLKMVVNVFERREVQLVRNVRRSLEEAIDLAKQDEDLVPERLERLEQMKTLAVTTESFLSFTLSTSAWGLGGLRKLTRRLQKLNPKTWLK